MHRRLLLAGLLAPIGARALDWDYSSFKYELSEDAVSGKRAFASWASAPRASFLRSSAEILKGARATKVGQSEAGPRKDLAFELEPWKLKYTVAVVRPKASNGLPPVVVFDGHADCGGECTGSAPKKMFDPGGFATKLLELGYTVISVPTAIHKPLEQVAKKHDYPTTWAALATLVLNEVLGQKRYFVVGSAIGGLTALSLAIIDKRAVKVVTSGAFFPLELTRREYRIKDHPFCHDYREFNSYTGVYALLAPKPLMVQMGKKDALWLGNGAVPPTSWFSGMKRGATVDETLGAALVLERIWRNHGSRFELVSHPGEHEDVDLGAVDAFLRG